jgi:NAD(P)-dependent dehydrogenase (short-subunit alcohol dehydrogenase family)
MSFDGKVVLITGGGGAIAQVIAEAFTKQGGTVVRAGRTSDGSPDWITADVTDSESVAAMVDTIVNRHGRLDIAVNAAGVFARPAPVADVDPTAWASVIDVNLTGVFHCMKHEIAAMKKQGGGAIINIGSNIGAHGRRPGMSAYAASKAAVSVLTQTAAREYIADGIRINAVSPGASDTPMSYRPGETKEDRDLRVATAVPAGRVSDPSEVAATVLWLASDDASFVVGHDLVVDGGATA